ncbi:hypothetical protein Tco_1086531 [Tanacetum coccineum]
MPWRHNDLSVAGPPPKSREFNETDVERLLVTMAEFLPFPTFRGSKIAAEKKRQKAVEKVATKVGQEAGAPEKAKKAAGNSHASKGGASRPKKKKARQETPSIVDMSSRHISSPVPLNHSKPFDTLANIPHASSGASASRLDVMRNQTDNQSPTHHDVVLKNIEENVVNEDAERNAADEKDIHHVAGGDNTGGGLSPHLGSHDRAVRSNDNIDEAESSSARRSWKQLGQYVQTQSNMLLRFEALSEGYVDLHHAHESCKDVKLRYNGCKNELSKLQAEHQDKVAARDLLLKDYKVALNVEKGLQDRVEELEEEKKE